MFDEREGREGRKREWREEGRRKEDKRKGRKEKMKEWTDFEDWSKIISDRTIVRS